MKLLAALGTIAMVSAAIVGIDLGHQYTKAMMMAPGFPFEIIFTDEGKRKDSSTIYLKPAIKDGHLEDIERIYGSQIGSLCTRFPDSCAANLKNLLGNSIDDVHVAEYLKHHHGVEIVENEIKGDSVSFKLGPSGNSHTFSVEELVAMSLNDLKLRAIKALSTHPKARPIAEDVAISVSPFADQITRLAYLDALQLANFSSVLGLVDEGSAAALGYISGKKFLPEDYNEKKVYEIIYDAGSGSTTATLFSYVAYQNRTIVVDVESVGYDKLFGGELLTNYVYNLLFERFLEQFKLDSSFELPPKLAARLTDTAEKAKTILSANSDYRVSLESFYDDRDFKATVTRKQFEDVTAELRQRVTQPIVTALENSITGPKTLSDIQSVILNGGTTRTPFIQKELVSLLGGEEKIAKTLNTDEACALGTTMRAYQLKMITGTGLDVTLHDRILSDLDVGFDGAIQNVFKRGSVSQNSTSISFGVAKEDQVSIELYENGKNFASYQVHNVIKKSDELKCNADDLELVGEFVVDQNKVFSMKSLHTICHRNETEDEEEPSSTASNSTVLKKRKPQLNKAKVAIPPLTFTRLRPYSISEKKDKIDFLTHLCVKEQEKIDLQMAKNLVESSCYSLKAFIDDHYETLEEELGGDELDSNKALADNIVEWLEYESDHATKEEVKEKMSLVNEARSKMDSRVRLANTDLSLEGLKKLLKEGNEVASQVQEYLLEYGSQIRKIRDIYEEESFDFDAENERIMGKLYGSKRGDELNLDKHLSVFKKSLEALSEMTNFAPEKFAKLTKHERFEKNEAVTSVLLLMMDDIVTLQKLHERRVDYLLTRIEKLRERKAAKEFKAKLKEEKEMAAGTNKTADSTEESGDDKNSTVVDNEPVDAKPGDEADTAHDEL